MAVLLGPLFGAATLQLPRWAQDISPFTHTPKLPAADLAALPVLGLIAIAAALVGRRSGVLPPAQTLPCRRDGTAID